MWEKRRIPRFQPLRPVMRKNLGTQRYIFVRGGYRNRLKKTNFNAFDNFPTIFGHIDCAFRQVSSYSSAESNLPVYITIDSIDSRSLSAVASHSPWYSRPG